MFQQPEDREQGAALLFSPKAISLQDLDVDNFKAMQEERKGESEIEPLKAPAIKLDANIQFKFGRAYENGHGMIKDKRRAVNWYRKAAEQGHEGAQYHLAVCYEEGIGVEKNEFLAMKWFQQAAKQGNVIALNALARLESKYSGAIDF
jgi:TPR repeat protein